MKDRHKNRGGHNKIDLTNKQFGNLTVIKDTGKRKTRRAIWLCRCSCGNEVEILSKYLLSNDTKSCGCITKGNSHNRKGFKTLGESYVYHVKSSAKKRGILFAVTAEDMYLQLEKQNFRCALSNIPINIVLNYRDEYKNQSASLDRIDNSKGYTPDNIQWVHKTVNIMRNSLSIEEFIKWCEEIYKHSIHTPR